MRYPLRIVALCAVAGSCTALAQPIPVDTQLRYEVRRYDPGNNDGWGPSVTANEGEQVEVRAVISFIGTIQVFGLGATNFQPIVSNWSTVDAVVTTPGTPGNQGIGPVGGLLTDPVGYVNDLPGVYGRISPWAEGFTTTSNFYRGHVHTGGSGGAPAGTWLRIARNDVTNWVGVGPVSGTGAVNNTNGHGGVNIGQGTIGVDRDSRYPAQNNNTANLVVFKFGFILGTGTPARTMVITTPPAGLLHSSDPDTYGQPNTRWFTDPNQQTPGLHRSDVAVLNAIVQVVPSPGAIGLLAWAWLAAARRTRR